MNARDEFSGATRSIDRHRRLTYAEESRRRTMQQMAPHPAFRVPAPTPPAFVTDVGWALAHLQTHPGRESATTKSNNPQAKPRPLSISTLRSPVLTCDSAMSQKCDGFAMAFAFLAVFAVQPSGNAMCLRSSALSAVPPPARLPRKNQTADIRRSIHRTTASSSTTGPSR